jgi:antitoxin ParD1/3/4
MNVSLTPELEEIVAARVRSGRYASASEVIREALRLLEQQDRFSQLRHDVQLGIEQLDHRQSRPFDREAVKRIKRRGRRRTASHGEVKRRQM